MNGLNGATRKLNRPDETAQDLNRITGVVVDSAFRIHAKLGPGLMEHVYETILARDLARQGLTIERQRTISFDFEGLWFDDACRVDLKGDPQCPSPAS